MANHSLPTLTSTYTQVLSELDARMDDIAIGFDPARTTATNMPVGTISWVSVANKWQKWSGGNWTDLTTEYSINISGNANTAIKLLTPRSINGVSFDGSAPITIAANTPTPLIFSSGGNGAGAGTSFNGNSATTISYNSIGAPSLTGSGASGTWSINITGTAASTAYASVAALANNATNATTASNAVSLKTTNWTVLEIGTKLLFKYGEVVVFSIDSAGACISASNITAYGTPY